MSERLLHPKTSEFEYMTVTEGMWYRRGPSCPMCEAPGLQGVIFQQPTPDMVAMDPKYLEGREICATCGFNVDVATAYGEKQTGRVRILFPPEEDGVEKNPYLNPLPVNEDKDWKRVFVQAGLHDVGNGRRLVLMFGERIRYTAGWGWLVYDGRRWVRDDRGTMDRFCKATIQEMQDTLLEPVWSQFEVDKKEFSRHVFASNSRGKIEAMLAMAASEPEVATGIEQFDQYPWLLNCKNGIVDLTTGTLRPADPELYLTQLIPHDYAEAAEAPRWLQFLDEITCHDPGLADYFHRAVGYTFTGETSEEKLFFMYGGGSNGKSKFIGALRHVLGDYGTSLSFEALLNSRNSSPEQGFAHLPGKRFAQATEAGGNRSWNQEALTRITGRDVLRGKQLYKDSFEFYPVCKLWVAANNMPRVEDYGEAMWRRLAVLPFQAHFEGATKDPDLEAKLQAEAQGILTWAIRGAQRWYRERLRVVPTVMEEALKEYREDSDIIGRWVAECCSLSPAAKATAKDLYASYRQFAQENNEREMTQTAFGSSLAKWKSGRLKKKRENTGIIWLGITTAAQAAVASLIDSFDPDVAHSQHERLRGVQEIVRGLSKESDRGYALEEDVVQTAALRGISKGEVEAALATLKRNNSVYAKGGSGTYAPLNP